MPSPLTLEEISLNAWPALQTVVYDGWLLRFAEGYTRRANSVNPLYPSTLDLDEKLAFCEELYRGRGLPVIVKLTGAAQPPGLDAALKARGYYLDAPTAVQLLDLERADLPPAPGPPSLLGTPGAPPTPNDAGPPSLLGTPDVEEALTPAWLEAYGRLSGLSEHNRSILPRILANIVPSHGYASVSIEGRIVATGLGILQSGWLGLYDIVTDPLSRGRGYGGQVVASLLRWGRARGATMAYLQVMLDNDPALRLYARLGFREYYRYWYRVRAVDA